MCPGFQQLSLRWVMWVVALAAALLSAFQAGRRFEASDRSVSLAPTASRSNPSNFDWTCYPPSVVGQVLEVDPKNGQVEVALGSDDGLAQGSELYVYRDEIPPRFLGKIRIKFLNYDHSLLEPVKENRGNPLPIREGDRVSSSPLHHVSK